MVPVDDLVGGGLPTAVCFWRLNITRLIQHNVENIRSFVLVTLTFTFHHVKFIGLHTLL